jgi:RimJ/RimL family protein N-acetyltransferase
MSSQPAFTYPVGPPCTVACTPLRRAALHGRFCSLEPLADEHAADLAEVWEQTRPEAWTYLWAPKPADAAAAAALVAGFVRDAATLHFAVTVSGRAVGSLALLRVDEVHGCVEVGHVNFTSAGLSRSSAATEAVALLLAHAFGSGFRRVEWKCDALNAPSRRAAARLGFSEEGTFRAHMVVKGRLRDTAWFSMLADEWPRARAAFERWLDAGNFDERGVQRASLADLRR